MKMAFTLLVVLFSFVPIFGAEAPGAGAGGSVISTPPPPPPGREVACALPEVSPAGAAPKEVVVEAAAEQSPRRITCDGTICGVAQKEGSEKPFGIEDFTAVRLGGGFDYFGVFDGHGAHGAGRRFAEFVARELPEILHGISPLVGDDLLDELKKIYKEVDERTKEIPDSLDVGGTTAISVVIKDGVMYVANVGDSRAVLARRDGAAIDLSRDQKSSLKMPAEELGRIIRAGGYLERDSFGFYYVCGPVRRLAMTRSIGDWSMKKVGIIAEPEVSARPITPEDSFIVLASDGIWDVFSWKADVNGQFALEHPEDRVPIKARSSQEVVDFIKIRMRAGVTDLNDIARELVAEANRRWTLNFGGDVDDISVVIVNLHR